MKVFKFGGGILNSAENILDCIKLVENQDDRLFIVISAFGKTTNLLEQITLNYFKGKDFKNLTQQLYDFHKKLLDLLKIDSLRFENLFDNFLAGLYKTPSLNFDFEYDRIVHYGEMFSSVIFCELLNSKGQNCLLVNANEIIKTDNNFRQANVLEPLSGELTRKIVNGTKHKIILTQGFIGEAVNHNRTTLGREGSDYTAALIANFLDVSELTIWKDVDGIFNADPKKYPGAVLINKIDYDEIIEQAYFGAKVLHHRTIFPLKQKNIKLYVKNFKKPQAQGTLITKLSVPLQPLMPVVIFNDNQILLTLKSKENLLIDEKIFEKIFYALKRYKIKLNLIQNSALKVSLVFDDNILNVSELINFLSEDFYVRKNENLRLITLRHYTQELLESFLKKHEIILTEITRSNAFLLVEQKK